MSAVGPFFVGGTGRSGTSQLQRVIGEHPLVHAIGHETRFLVDPGGLEDLARALTVGYTPYHADDALRRLAWLLRERLTGQTMEEFRGWALDQELGVERYQNAISGLWRELVWYDLEVDVPARRSTVSPPTAPPGDGRWHHAPGEELHHRRVIGKYFPDRTELIAILRSFVGELFGGAAADAGKATWLEKTPFNLLSIPFLWEVFPESTVIVIARHPMSVVASHVDQSWAPSTVTEVLNWLAPVYERWLEARPELLGDPRYVEVRIEDLADRWPKSRTEFFERLGLPDTDTTAVFSPDRVHHRDRQLTAVDRDEVSDRLGWAIDRLGYTTPGS
ncbi:MAG: sulfotransferase [Acidimicrobiaceae bacterium]|nr:sulfotransferase [Acidimicrobiaceae bacterium]